MVDVVVLGACNMDLISYVKRAPAPGETIHGYDFKTGFGGKGANQCVMAAKMGAKTAMIGKVGDDSYGSDTLQNFKNQGVDVEHVGVVSDKPTGVAPITVDSSGQNSIIIVNGANDELTVEDIDGAATIISQAKVLVCQNEIQPHITLAAIKAASKAGVKTVFNLAPAVADVSGELLELADVFCVNETEASIVTGMPVANAKDAAAAALFLRTEKRAKTIILTLGSQGSYVLPREGAGFLVPCEQVDAKDTSGAGDCFLGAFAYLVAAYPDMPLRVQVEKAGSIATQSVLKTGTQSSYPSREEVADLLP